SPGCPARGARANGPPPLNPSGKGHNQGEPCGGPLRVRVPGASLGVGMGEHWQQAVVLFSALATLLLGVRFLRRCTLRKGELLLADGGRLRGGPAAGPAAGVALAPWPACPS